MWYFYTVFNAEVESGVKIIALLKLRNKAKKMQKFKKRGI